MLSSALPKSISFKLKAEFKPRTQGFSKLFSSIANTPLNTIIYSKTIIPEAEAGTLSIDHGAELSMDKQTWSTSLTYIPGNKLYVRLTTPNTYITQITYTVTGIGFSNIFNVTTKAKDNVNTWNDSETWNDTGIWND